MYYLVVDLEATCCEGSRCPDSETIEIGAVMVDGEFQTVSEFDDFIQPMRHPILTEFCQKLTGVTQLDVVQARVFPEVFRNFRDWFGQYGPFGPDKFLSWGTFDPDQLNRDCKNHEIACDMPPYTNLARLFTKKTGRRKGHRGAMKILGIEPEGAHHRGIDDARNIAKMVPILLER